MPILSDVTIHKWIQQNAIKNEKGDLIEFGDHLFLYEIYGDDSQNIAVMKPAQVGMSTLQVIKNHYDAKRFKLDIIYTLPTDGDVGIFVSGKVNRIIQNNPCMLADVADKDSIEQKQIGQSYEYFRGTWTKKAAIMITADRLTHDEIDSSKLSTIADFPARLQHSKRKQIHVFSHPSVSHKGVHAYFEMSDQKEWFITCNTCGKSQVLTWNTEEYSKMSVDLGRKRFRCKKCDATLSDDERAIGVWRKKKGTEGAKWSGYHISLLMASWVSAEEICDKWQEIVDGKQTTDFFYNKVLGLPFAGGGNTVDEDTILGAWTEDRNQYNTRLVIGVDTGIALRYVVGNRQGLVGYGEMKDYEPRKKTEGDPRPEVRLEDSLEYWLQKFPNSIMVIDENGDITGSRMLARKYPGRVFLCHYIRDRKTQELIRWGKGKEGRTVYADRNRMIQLVAEEFRRKGIRLFNGDKNSWWDYWLHWSHIYRIWDMNTLDVPEFKWMREGRDDWVHATVYWRVGLSRFGSGGAVIGAGNTPEPNSYLVNANQSVTFNPNDMFKLDNQPHEDEENGDWRD